VAKVTPMAKVTPVYGYAKKNFKVHHTACAWWWTGNDLVKSCGCCYGPSRPNDGSHRSRTFWLV